MVGGGSNSWIDAVHRMAATMDGQGLLGKIEAFANIYLEAFKAIRAQLTNQPLPTDGYATVDDGISIMCSIETAVASTKSNDKWVKIIHE